MGWRVRVLMLVAILCLGGGAWWLLRTAPAGPLVPPYTPHAGEESELAFKKVRIKGIEDGKIAWELWADDFSQSKTRPVLTVRGLKKAVMLNGEQQELVLTADRLERNISSGDIDVNGNVMVTGAEIVMRTQQVHWNARQEQLVLPAGVAAQLGDIAVTNQGGGVYNVLERVLRCDGPLRVATGGNTITAQGVLLEVKAPRLTVVGPAVAEFQVQDLAGWAGGQDLPEIPPIPESVKARYRAYLAKKAGGRTPPGRGVGR